jgi:hypothetical protein
MEKIYHASSSSNSVFMGGVILTTKAIRVEHRMSYTRYFNTYETFTELGVEKKKRTRKQQEVPACEAVVFKCPAEKGGCGKLNNQSILSAKGQAGESLSFKCCRCGREIEVARPEPEGSKIIVPGITSPKPMELIGLDGRPLR